MLKRFGSCQKGAAAVEFALLLPVLMLITFGIIEFGFIMYDLQILTNASREGARAGVVIPYLDDTAIKLVVENSASKLVSFKTSTITTTTGVCTTPGGLLMVSVEYDYNFLVPLMFPFVNGGKKTLNPVTVMRCE
jgi:Flp pilus assembly protein TadG